MALQKLRSFAQFTARFPNKVPTYNVYQRVVLSIYCPVHRDDAESNDSVPHAVQGLQNTCNGAIVRSP